MKRNFKLFLLSLLSISLSLWPMEQTSDEIDTILASKFKDVSLGELEQKNSEIKAIIFDVGNVLVKTDKIAFAKNVIGIDNFVKLGFASLTSFNISLLTKLQEKVLDIIAEIDQQKPFENGQLSMYGGKKLPGLMCKHSCGDLKDSQIDSMVQSYIDLKFKEDVNLEDGARKFKNETEVKVLKAIVSAMFDPEKLAYFHKPINGMTQVLDALKNSPKKYKLLILSNWGAQSFGCLKISKESQEIFKYFSPEDIFVSGYCRVMKPDTKAYENILDHIKKTYDIEPKNCLMIDDQDENIYAAQQFAGMQAIKFKDAKQLREDLEKRKILDAPKKSSWW